MFSICCKRETPPLTPQALEFIRALEEKNVDVAMALIETDREALAGQDEEGNCALHWVILHEQHELIPKLLEGETPWRKKQGTKNAAGVSH